MKKLLFFFLLAITGLSCSKDDASESHEYLVPVVDATVPDHMTLGQTGTLQVKYKRPTDCDVFNGFYTQTDGYNQIISVKCLKFNEGNCMADTTVYEAPLQFVPNVTGTYRFKFWKGDYTNGEPNYLEFDCVVE